jgi:hypothetical protein
LGPDSAELPVRQHDPEEGDIARTLVPADGVQPFVSPVEGGSLKPTADGYEATLRRDPNTDAPAEACFELKAELALRDRDVLAVDLALLAPTAATRIAISVEKRPSLHGLSRSRTMLPASRWSRQIWFSGTARRRRLSVGSKHAMRSATSSYRSRWRAGWSLMSSTYLTSTPTKPDPPLGVTYSMYTSNAELSAAYRGSLRPGECSNATRVTLAMTRA